MWRSIWLMESFNPWVVGVSLATANILVVPPAQAIPQLINAWCYSHTNVPTKVGKRGVHCRFPADWSMLRQLRAGSPASQRRSLLNNLLLLSSATPHPLWQGAA